MTEPETTAVATTAVAAAPVPSYSPEQMIEALTRYRALQRALDDAMPEQIIRIGEARFRKKGYWRAIAVAFNLTVEPLDEQRSVHGQFTDGTENFGYLVTYRATAPNGRAAIGDGASFAVEKASRFRCPHPHPTREGKTLHYPAEQCPDFDPQFAWRALPAQATEHNIRSHAHTRAYNRAVSNLVGFAETPAEEVDADADRPLARRSRRGPRASADTIDAAQRKRLFERAHEAGYSDDALRDWLRTKGIAETAQIRRDDYDALVDELLLQRPTTTTSGGLA